MKGHAWKQEDRAKPCGTTAPSDKKSTQAITQVEDTGGWWWGGGGLVDGIKSSKEERAFQEWQVPETA